MEKNMKKLILTGFAVLFALALITCDMMPGPLGGGDGELNIVDVVYSPDGSSVTLYFDGGAPASSARAINTDIAKFYHNLYEVVFVYMDDMTPIVARANWRYGESAAIRGVYRGGNGVDYSNVVALSDLNDGDGSAVLFVGRDSDKALLAIGKITLIDGTAASATNLLTVNTSNVTFALSALDIGVATLEEESALLDPDDIPKYVVSTSSFLTAAKHNTGAAPHYVTVSSATTDIRRTSINGNPFPLYYLPRGEDSIAADYTINNASDDFTTNYMPGVYVAGAGVVDRRLPIISIGGVTKSITDTLVNKSTTITQNNNNTVGALFANPITFTFNTSLVTETQSGVFSFWFKIPVYALTRATAPEGDSFITWNIQPGIGVEYLDDGTEIGANILIGVAMSEVDNLIVLTTGPTEP